MVSFIIKKSLDTIRQKGWGDFFSISFKVLKYTLMTGKKKLSVKNILIINGCHIEHPARYRVSHQLEQLEFNGTSCDKIWYKDLTEELLGRYRGFIFFRCIHTPFIGKFIEQGKKYNKTFFYDIDDLMFDEEEVGKIEYVKKLEGKGRENYYYGVRNSLKLMKLCDFGITTTYTLRKEMAQFIPEVYINRNVASEAMLYVLHKAENKEPVKKNTNRTFLSYSSGSITHDPDLEMISGALRRVLEEDKRVTLILQGHISVPKVLGEVKGQITIKPFKSWRHFYKELKHIDINLAPLEDTKFNRAKSENKWTEASLAKKVTVASNVGAFKDVIKNNETGILADNTEEDWYRNLKEIIRDKRRRVTIGENAYKEALKTHTTVNSGREFSLWIKSKLKPSIGFVLPNINISGGVLVAIRHACFLMKAGYDVLSTKYWQENKRHVSIQNMVR